MDRGTWWTTVHGVAKNQTWLTIAFFHFQVLKPVGLRDCEQGELRTGGWEIQMLLSPKVSAYDLSPLKKKLLRIITRIQSFLKSPHRQRRWWGINSIQRIGVSWNLRNWCKPGLFWHSCYWPGFLASLINRNWSKTRQKVQARLSWGPCCSSGGGRTKNKFLCSLPRERWADSLHGVRVGMCPEVRLEGWFQWFAHSFGAIVCRGHVQSGSCVLVFFFGLCVSFVQNLLQMCIHIVIFSLLWFLSILLLEEMFVQVQALQQSSKGSQVPGLFQNELWNSDFEHLIRFLCIGIFSHYGHQKEKPKLNRRQTLPRHEHHCNQDLIIISSSYSRPNKIQLLAEMWAEVRFSFVCGF